VGTIFQLITSHVFLQKGEKGMKGKLLTVAAVALSCAMGLSGCSTAPKNQGMAGNGGDDGTTTAGIGGDNGGFGGGNGGVICSSAPGKQMFYFALNSDAVTAAGSNCLKAQANYLIAHASSKVRLEGNCDNRGSREYNRGLGWRRANAVKSILLQDGVSPKQITTFSWGSEKAAPGVGEDVWAKDRRVDMFYR
jgi:peptidoglycan-associated lipoprotein